MTVSEDIAQALAQVITSRDILRFALQCSERVQEAIDAKSPIAAREWLEAANAAIDLAHKLGGGETL